MKTRRILSLLLALTLLLGMMSGALAIDMENHTHSYVEVKNKEIEPWCERAGQKVYECICGDSYTETIPALGHDWGEWQDPADGGGVATCTQSGTQVRYCRRCQASETRTVPAKGHTWGNWNITKEPTCTEEGSRERWCRYQDGHEVESIPALGHDFQKYQDTKATTCTEAGERTYYCGRCQATKTEAVPALGHSWGGWQTTKEPTCTAAGTQERTCSRCGAKETQSIPALGHSQSGWQTVKEPTCTAEGRKESKCTRCGETYTESIPALGHSYGTWTTTREPTCAQSGEKETTCSRCGQKVTDTIPTTAHTWGEWYILVEAGDWSEGTMERACQVCGAKEQKPYYKDGTVLPEDRGGAMQHLQELLNQNGFDCGKADGIYGPKTQAAVEAAEQAAGHPATGIGWTGLIEWLQGGAKTEEDKPAISLTISADPNAGEGKRYEGAIVPVYCKVTNTGNCGVFVAWWDVEEWSSYTLISGAENEPWSFYLGDTHYDGISWLSPGATFEYRFDKAVLPSEVSSGKIELQMTQTALYHVKGGKDEYVFTADSNKLEIPLTYPDDDQPHPDVTMTITADPDAGVGKRYEGAIVPLRFEIENTGNWPVYVTYWSEWGNSYWMHDFSAPRDPVTLENPPSSHDSIYLLLNPGEKTSCVYDARVFEANVISGELSCSTCAHYYWQSEEDGKLKSRITNEGEATVTLTYPGGEEKTPKAALTLMYLYDCDQFKNPYPEDQDTFDADDSVYAGCLYANTGDVPLVVVCHYKAEGVKEYDLYWERLNPGESRQGGWGSPCIGNHITPGTETADLLGTFTVSYYYMCYDPDTYVNLDNRGPELCRTQTITRTWKVRKPSTTPGGWEIPEESQLTVTLTELGSSSNLAGYQLGEKWYTWIRVKNVGPVDVDDFTVHVDYVAANQFLTGESWMASEGPTWYEFKRSTFYTGALKAGWPSNYRPYSPCGRITEEDVARGYVYAIATVKWTDPDSGKERTAKSDPLYLPVISKTGLLVKKGIAHKPENGEYFQEGEPIDWVLTVTNNSKETVYNVVVTDKGVVVGTFAEIAPGETKVCTVPPHVVTEYEATVAGSVSNVAKATGEDAKGISHTWYSNTVQVPTNEFSPVPLPTPYDPDGTPVKDPDGDGDPLPPGTPETPWTPGVPGGGFDPLGPIVGVKAGATVYKTTAHDPKNHEWYALGEPVDYTVTVKNVGDVPLQDLKLYDSLGGLAPIGTLPTLAPGEEYTFTFTWVVTQKNIDDGYVVNSATLTYTFMGMHGTPMKSNPVYVLAGENGHLPDDHIIDDLEHPHFPGLTEHHSGPDGMGVLYCTLETRAIGEGEILYNLHTCQEHALVAGQAETLPPKEAAGLWREEIEKMYALLYEAGNDEGKAAVLNDRIIYWAFVETFSGLYQDDEALCDMLRLRCAELCSMIHTAPGALADSLLSPSAATLMVALTEAEKCARTVDEQAREVILAFDEEHAAALTETMDQLHNTSPYASAEVFTRAQSIWATELDRVVNYLYKAADREGRTVIAAWRIGLDNLIATRLELLALLYDGVPEASAESVMNLYRDALIDACSHS